MADQAIIADFPEVMRFLFDPWRYKITYGGRGGLKSWSYARANLIDGIRKPLRCLCARETMESIAQSVHQLLRDQIQLLNLGMYYSVQKATIEGIGRDTLFTFAGLSHNVANIKSLEAYDRLWVEEAQTVSKNSWETIIPTIRKENSEIWAGFNPKLSTDDTYKRFVVNPPPNAKVVKTSWRDNPWFPEVLRVEMEHLKSVDYESYLHVYEGECLQNIVGAIFGKELKLATAENRIGLVPYNRRYPVDTVWDLGFSEGGDPCAIWFVQSYDGFFHFIDYYENRGEDVPHYLLELQKRNYVYGTAWVPFDAVDNIIHKRAVRGTNGASVEQQLRTTLNVRMVAKVLIIDRINAGRTLLPQCRFDEKKCADGLQALRHFQWGELDKNGVHKREPLHNWASHAAEAFTRAGQILRQPTAKTSDTPAPPPRMPFVQNYAPLG